MLNYYEIGQRIRKIRRAHDMPQEQLAEMVNISTVHMSHIENGSTKMSLAVLVDIALALNVSTDELLFDTHPGQQKQSTIDDIESVLAQCTPQQANIISEIIKSAKTAMDKYN